LTRPHDRHLDKVEIEALISSNPQRVASSVDSSEAIEEAAHHVEGCETCRRTMQMHRSAQDRIAKLVGVQTAEGPDCSDDRRWLRVAAGLEPEADVVERLRHAAECGHCGPLLVAAAKLLGDESTPEEVATITNLASAHVDWQRKMARNLADGGRPHQKSEHEAPSWPGLFTWSRIALATVGFAVMVTAVFLAYQQFHPPSVQQLLAEAYTDYRTLEVRIPGAGFAPKRAERGVGRSNLDKPPALLKAEAMVAEGLHKKPNDPTWLDAKARADLLDGNYESAIKSLQRALEIEPDSSSLLTDLGSAYFLRAEMAERSLDYGNAIESLGAALAKSPDDPIALYNRALAYERMYLYAQAVDDWEHYLRVDPSGKWADDARRRVVALKDKIRQHNHSQNRPLLDSSKFAAVIDASRDEAISEVDRRIERYIEAVIQPWLTQSYDQEGRAQGSANDAHRALVNLAAILKTRHDDTWLIDFLERSPTAVQKESFRFLRASDEALHSGRYGLSVEFAKKAVNGFGRANNQPGLLRAYFSLMLAETLSLKTSDCLKTSAAAIPLLANTRYHWLQSQALIQQGQCQAGSEQFEDAMKSTLKGVEIARRYGFPSLELRASAFTAAYRSRIGSADRAWSDLVSGLTTYWTSDVTSTRGENLYSVLFQFAGDLNWPRVEASAIAEKIMEFPTSDAVDEALGLELLAGAQQRAADYKSAQVSLRNAAEKLGTLPEDSGIVLRKAEISLENAEIQRSLGDLKGALATLGQLRLLPDSTPPMFQAEYFKTYGEANLDLGLDQAAELQLEKALSLTEIGLKGLTSEIDKLAWSRADEQLYRDLCRIKLNIADPAAAFAWWEWYKGASLRIDSKQASSSVESNPEASPTIPSYSLPTGTILISYAVLGETTIAFVLRDGRVRTRVLQHADARTLQPRRFLSLCTDASADLNSFYAESERLYDALVAPLESDIQGATALRIETDGILDNVPFDLLRQSNGRYLADQFEVTYSPGLAYESRPRPKNLAATSAVLIVVAAEAQDRSSGPLPEAVEESTEIASFFPNAIVLAGSHATRGELLSRLPKARMFHFVGHAVARVDRVGLLLGPDSVVNSRDLTNVRSHNLWLVVLSACETANGSDGAFADGNSLARTLTAAGVPQTVAARWKVDSSVTRQLMHVFYSNLMTGDSVGHSLRAAIAAIRGTPEFHHPYYWGSFALFGN
jgi:CHAT domain-containing protein